MCRGVVRNWFDPVLWPLRWGKGQKAEKHWHTSQGLRFGARERAGMERCILLPHLPLEWVDEIRKHLRSLLCKSLPNTELRVLGNKGKLVTCAWATGRLRQILVGKTKTNTSPQRETTTGFIIRKKWTWVLPWEPPTFDLEHYRSSSLEKVRGGGEMSGGAGKVPTVETREPEFRAQKPH